MTTQSTVRPLCEAPPDLRVEALSLPWLHGDVARERVEQTEVLLGAVTDLPVEVANNHVLEQAASLDLGAIVGDATGSQHGYARGHPLADLFIDVLDLGEERVTAFGDDVGGSPEGEVAGGTQQLPGSLVAQRRVDPVPGRGREDEIKPIAGRWLPGLEGPTHDLHEWESREVATGDRREVWADLDAGDSKAASGKRKCCLPGGATDLQKPIADADSGDLDEGVVERLGILGPGLLIQVGRGVETSPQTLPIIRHRTIIARLLPLFAVLLAIGHAERTPPSSRWVSGTVTLS